jgi:hypothetical protein
VTRPARACVALVVVVAMLVVLGVGSPSRSQTPAPTTFALVAHADAPDAVRAWLDAQVGQANALFAPAEVAFELVEVRASPSEASLASIDDRAARDALGTRVALSARGEPTRVNVFLTERLVDVDDPPNERMGVHWRARRARNVHYVILSRRAWPTTLAHELGHYFGNPHSRTPNNLMSYDRDGTTPPFFDAGQLARIRAHARRYLRAGLERR